MSEDSPGHNGPAQAGAEQVGEDEKLWRALFDASPEMIFVHSSDGRVLQVNDHALEVFGVSRAEMLLAGPDQFSGENQDPGLALAGIEEAMVRGEANFEWISKTRDGVEFPVQVRLRRLSKEMSFAPSDPAVVAVVRDLRELKAISAAQADTAKLEALSTLAGSLSHDFNNVLTGLLANLTLAHLTAGPEAMQFLELAETSVQQAGRLVQKLQTFARGGAPVTRPLHLVPLLESSCKLAQLGKRTQIETQFPESLPQVMADAAQLGLLIQNLLLNAEQAQATRVSLDLQEVVLEIDHHLGLAPGRYLHLELEDNGEGIHEELLSRVFDPYFTTRPRGSGLGLAMARSVARAHKGELYVESLAGHGSVFHLLIPTTDEEVEEGLNPADEIVSIRGEGRVLLMDDDELILLAGRRILSDAGYEVSIATQGDKAIEIATAARREGKAIQLAILDLVLPGGLDGVATLLELRVLNPKILAIASSGYSNDPVLSNPSEYGFDEVLPKPYLPRALVRAARQAMQKMKP